MPGGPPPGAGLGPPHGFGLYQLGGNPGGAGAGLNPLERERLERLGLSLPGGPPPGSSGGNNGGGGPGSSSSGGNGPNGSSSGGDPRGSAEQQAQAAQAAAQAAQAAAQQQAAREHQAAVDRLQAERIHAAMADQLRLQMAGPYPSLHHPSSYSFPPTGPSNSSNSTGGGSSAPSDFHAAQLHPSAGQDMPPPGFPGYPRPPMGGHLSGHPGDGVGAAAAALAGLHPAAAAAMLGRPYDEQFARQFAAEQQLQRQMMEQRFGGGQPQPGGPQHPGGPGGPGGGPPGGPGSLHPHAHPSLVAQHEEYIR